MYLHIGGLVVDATPEQIQKVMNLYNRPGTPGEKAAAEAALLRMGVDPSTFEQPRSQSTYTYTPKPTGPYEYEIRVYYKRKGEQQERTWGPMIVASSDAVGAEAKGLDEFKKWWRSNYPGERVPQWPSLIVRSRRL